MDMGISWATSSVQDQIFIEAKNVLNKTVEKMRLRFMSNTRFTVSFFVFQIIKLKAIFMLSTREPLD
jgi:hypothetical protein